MSLNATSSRDDIYFELADSNYRNTGVDNNHLQDMYEYVFNDTSGNYSRTAFDGYGWPHVSNLSATGGDGVIDLTWDCDFAGDDNTGTLQITFIAQYWEETADVTPSPYYEEIASTSFGSGSKSGQISANVSNGTTYEVRVTAYNVFNNYTASIPAPRSETNSYDWTNTATATPSSPQLNEPSALNDTPQWDGINVYVNFSYSDDEDNFEGEYRINGGTATSMTINCENGNIGTNNTNIEIDWEMQEFPNPGDDVDIRMKATSNTIQDSEWSSWFNTNEDSNKPTCPL